MLVVLWTGAINNSVKAGEETTPSVRALKRKCYEVHHFTFKRFKHNEHVLCVTEKTKHSESAKSGPSPWAREDGHKLF